MAYFIAHIRLADNPVDFYKSVISKRFSVNGIEEKTGNFTA